MTSGSARDKLYELSLRFHRLTTPLRIALDVTAWCVAAIVATFLRLGLHLSDQDQSGLRTLIVVVAVVQVLAGTATGLYRRKWFYGSFDEVRALLLTTLLTTGLLFAFNGFYVGTRPIPQSALLVGGVFGLVLMAGCRYLWRLVIEQIRRPDLQTAEKLLIYGAGEGGLQMITAMMRSRSSPYIPVGLLDDDPSKERLRIMGVSVLGGRHDMAAAKQRTGATTLLIAVPSASAQTIGELSAIAEACDLKVKVLPPVTELLGDQPNTGDIRDVTEEDLLGRHQIQINLDEIAGYLTARKVLVTGAGGSIGSELCRQLIRFAPAELMMLDRDESALHSVQLSIYGRALLDTPDTILADIRDVERMRSIFEQRQPDVVFHAAALKHLPLLEQYPDEAMKSNVTGTLNVLEAARLAGSVKVFVNISTDKAANPISVLGCSKRVAERLTAHYGHQLADSAAYLSVRFGNVLGSRGSVLTTFREQIDNGGPVTVTDHDVTRFFMTIPEAVQLVIQAGAIGRSGEVLVLDMGEPVRIYEVARRLVAKSGERIPIVLTGLRPGEKLHEELFGEGELDHRPYHKLISHAPVPPLDPSTLTGRSNDVRRDMYSWS